ncbi:MAG: 50S ribosomal protein L15 [Chloroflexi bacterium]|nr:MAG: 50S ribosomal protein L15 [Chloroflexota bacterium]
MHLHELQPPPGSRRPRKRVGRGIAAGQGKTSGRGQKGQFSRSSPGLPRGFEGGQMPLSQRLPKLRGFHNRFRKRVSVVNVGKLNRFPAGSVVDADALVAAGIAQRARDGVKVLGAGRIRVALTLRVDRISAAARKAVESAGGTVEVRLPAAAAEVPTSALATGAPTRGPRRPGAAQVEAGEDEFPDAEEKEPAAAEEPAAAAPRRRGRVAATAVESAEEASPGAEASSGAEQPSAAPRRRRKKSAADVESNAEAESRAEERSPGADGDSDIDVEPEA